MVVTAGTSASYYVCGDAKKRGTCGNKNILREDVARAAILGVVREALFTPAAVTFLRKKIAERLRLRAQTAEADLKERVDRLRRTEERIHGLVKFIADGDDSKYVRETLRDLEAQAKADAAAVERLKSELKSPVRLPTPDALRPGTGPREDLRRGPRSRAGSTAGRVRARAARDASGDREHLHREGDVPSARRRHRRRPRRPRGRTTGNRAI